MAYIALKAMKVGDDLREYGEPIPEAADWKPMIRAAYERAGSIRLAMPDELDAAQKKMADRQALVAKRERDAEREARRAAKAAQKAASSAEPESGDQADSDLTGDGAEAQE